MTRSPSGPIDTGFRLRYRPVPTALRHTLTTVEYFTFSFGSMVGVGWVVLIDDWLERGGPAGAMIAFGLGGLLLLPVAQTYGRLVLRIPDAGAEIAYAEGVFPPLIAFAAGWTMVLAYAIVCPWEAVAIGNLLARAFPGVNVVPLYTIGGHTVFAPRLAAGLLLTGGIVWLNRRGIAPSGRFQNATTFGLLALFAVFVVTGFASGSPANLSPLFPNAGLGGAWLSVLLVLQVVPYFMTGFESVAKASEEARPDFDPRNFARAIRLAIGVGAGFYVIIIGAVSFVYPWRLIVSGSLGTEAAFERALRSHAMAELVLFAALLSLLKIFNGNFVAATRLMLAVGRRRLVHGSLAYVSERYGTPTVAIALLGVLTAIATCLGDAVLVPITEVGSLAVGIGWLSACLAFLARSKGEAPAPRITAAAGALVSGAIVLMKALPAVPGSFTPVEWLAFSVWLALGGVFWILRASGPGSNVPGAGATIHGPGSAVPGPGARRA
jgi:APA family basic amino acid/polyamine antiporter